MDNLYQHPITYFNPLLHLNAIIKEIIDEIENEKFYLIFFNEWEHFPNTFDNEQIPNTEFI